jgi:hypothetical protein
MSHIEHAQMLQAKHAQIEETIRQETLRPAPDELKLNKLKKDKLQLKEKLWVAQN